MDIQAIKAKYKDQWVLARVTKEDASGQALEVEPLDQAETRAEMEAKLAQCNERHVTVIYTGQPKAQI